MLKLLVKCYCWLLVDGLLLSVVVIDVHVVSANSVGVIVECCYYC